MLSVNDGNAFNRHYDYCIKGDELTLQDKDTLEIFTLTRTNTFGVPTACATRTLDECASDNACHVGSCVGAGCPSVNSEASCTNHAGCKWDKTVCDGSPRVGCAIGDYNVVPGCVQGDTPPHCAGTAAPCSTYDAAHGFKAEACTRRTGCVPAPGCTGPWTSDCKATVVDACDQCHPGCSCSPEFSYFKCGGKMTCADQQTYFDCNEMACTWNEFQTCGGMPPDCKSLSVNDCATVVGCALTAD